MKKAFALVREGVHAVTWMFEMQPLDPLNKNYHDEEYQMKLLSKKFLVVL